MKHCKMHNVFYITICLDCETDMFHQELGQQTQRYNEIVSDAFRREYEIDPQKADYSWDETYSFIKGL